MSAGLDTRCGDQDESVRRSQARAGRAHELEHAVRASRVVEVSLAHLHVEELRRTKTESKVSFSCSMTSTSSSRTNSWAREGRSWGSPPEAGGATAAVPAAGARKGAVEAHGQPSTCCERCRTGHVRDGRVCESCEDEVGDVEEEEEEGGRASDKARGAPGTAARRLAGAASRLAVPSRRVRVGRGSERVRTAKVLPRRGATTAAASSHAQVARCSRALSLSLPLQSMKHARCNDTERDAQATGPPQTPAAARAGPDSPRAATGRSAACCAHGEKQVVSTVTTSAKSVREGRTGGERPGASPRARG